MNILFITKEIPYPDNNGHRKRTLNILKGLSGEHIVSLVCSRDKGEDHDLTIINQYCKKVYIAEQERTTRTKLYLKAFLSLFSMLPFNSCLRRSKEVSSIIQNVIKNENIDLIFCDSIYQAVNIPENNCKMVLCEHNIESVILQRGIRYEPNLLRKIFIFIELKKLTSYENRTWLRFQRCFVCSEIDKRILAQRVKGIEVDVVENGVDTNYFSPDPSIEVKSKSLVYSGLIGWSPNEDAVVYFIEKIYPMIKEQVPDVTFQIVGRGASKKIKRLADQDKSIDLAGFVDDIRDPILKSDVYVVPLRIGSGTRLKILEAMSMGKQIVSTSIGAEGIEVISGENIIIADDPQMFAVETIKLLNAQDEEINLSENARKLIQEKYSWEIIINNLNNYLRTC